MADEKLHRMAEKPAPQCERLYRLQQQSGKRQRPRLSECRHDGKMQADYDEINGTLKKYEAICGRTPLSKAIGDIPMDLDIVMWNDEIIRDKDFRQEYFQTGWKQLQKHQSHE